MAGFVLQSVVTVFYVVESAAQGGLGSSLNGARVDAVVPRDRGSQKAFTVDVRRVLYPRTCSTETSALSGAFAGAP